MDITHLNKLAVGAIFGLLIFGTVSVANAQYVAESLAEMRSYGATLSNSTVALSGAHGDPHPETGVVTPGEYWINGNHIANPTGSEPIFLELSGTGNTYDLSAAIIFVDTRDLAGFGRALGHDSGVDIVQITGSNNTVLGLTLIAQDLALDSDPSAQRFADWATQFVELSGDNNTVDGCNVVTRGSRTDAYGLSDAFGKGASQGMSPYILHRKASAFRVGEATNAVVNDMHLEVNSFGHGFFVQYSTNTTLTNSSVTGELFLSNLVVNHPLYQDYGFTWWGYPIPDNVMLSGAEGGVRVYNGASGLTVDNVIVTRMRTGFATVHCGGDVQISNSYAMGTTSGFDVGDNTTITNCGGDIVNGPLLVFYGGFAGDSTIELELLEGQPIGTNWSAIYLNGDNVDLTLTSSLDSDDLPTTSLVRLGQSYFENWRNFDYNIATPEDGEPIPLTNSVFTNNTNQNLVLGQNAIGNSGFSQSFVITNGKENYYDGVSLVPAGKKVVLVHEAGLGNNGTEADGSLDANASIVESGGTLELESNLRITDEKLTISGHGTDGLGALYSEGGTGSAAPRFGSSNSGDESTIFLDGDASIGVGQAGNQLLVGRIQGQGNLTKLGNGILSIEKSSTFLGNLLVNEGEVVARSGVVNHSLSVMRDASIVAIGNMLSTPDGDVDLEGVIDLNGRTDDSFLSGTIGSLSGLGSLTTSNPSATSGASLNLAGDEGVWVFGGTIESNLSLIKSGENFQSLTGDLTYTGVTWVQDGTLAIECGHTGSLEYAIGEIEGELATLELNSGFISTQDLTLRENSRLIMTIGSATRADAQSAGSSEVYSAIDVDYAILGGTLEVDFGFSPNAGDTFDLINLSEGQFVGEFDEVTATGLPADFQFFHEITPNETGLGETFRVRFLEPEIVGPEQIIVSAGISPGGRLVELLESDDQDFAIQRNILDIQSRTGFIARASTSIQSPSLFEITLEGSVFARNQVNQIVELFDFDSQSWDQVDLRPASRFVDEAVTVQATGDLSRYVENGTGHIEARIRYQSVRPRQRFTSNTDVISWRISGE